MNNIDNFKTKLNNLKNLTDEHERNYHISKLKETILYICNEMNIDKPQDSLFDEGNQDNLDMYIDYLFVLIDTKTLSDLSTNNIDLSMNSVGEMIEKLYQMDRHTKTLEHEMSKKANDLSNIVPEMNNMIDNFVEDLYKDFADDTKIFNIEESDIEESGTEKPDIDDDEFDKELDILQKKLSTMKKNPKNLKNNPELEAIEKKLGKIMVHNLSETLVENIFNSNPKLNQLMKMMEENMEKNNEKNNEKNMEKNN